MRQRRHTYDADLDLVLPDVGATRGVATVSEPQVLVTEATYFDTLDRRLAAVSVTVRRQTGDPGAGWLLELPNALDPDDTPDGGTLHVPDPLTASLPARDPSA